MRRSAALAALAALAAPATHVRRLAARGTSSATTAAAALALVVAVAALSGCGGGAAAAGDPTAGWTVFHDRARGLTVRFPSSWHRARVSLTPNLAAPKELLSLGTFPLRRGGPDTCPQMPMGAVAAAGATDVFISIQELGRHGRAAPRPRPFALGRPVAPPGLECVGTSPSWRSYWTRFDDAGRGFYLLALVGREASAARVRQLHRVLDSLRFARA